MVIKFERIFDLKCIWNFFLSMLFIWDSSIYRIDCFVFLTESSNKNSSIMLVMVYGWNEVWFKTKLLWAVEIFGLSRFDLIDVMEFFIFFEPSISRGGLTILNLVYRTKNTLKHTQSQPYVGNMKKKMTAKFFNWWSLII